MSSFGLGIWVFAKTGAATPLLLTAFFNELPGMLAGSLAGVLVDRWNRRTAMIVADTGQAVGSLFLLWSFTSGQFQLWHLYLTAFGQGCFAILQSPAQDAAVTMLVPDAERERANALRETIFPFAGVIAPVLAGFVYAWGGVSSVILVDLATFGIAVSAVLLIRIPQPKMSQETAAARGHFGRELLLALRFLRDRPSLLYLIAYMTLMNFFLNGPLDLTIPYVMSISSDERLLGVFMGLTSLGAFTGAIIAGGLGRFRPRLYLILGGSLLSGMMFMLYGVARHPWLLGAALFVLFIPLPIGGAMLVSIYQVKIPPDLQGRVFAIDEQLALLGSTTSFLLTGFVVDRWLEPAVNSPAWRVVAPLVGDTPGSGIGLLQFANGVVIILVTLAALALPKLRNLEIILPDYAAESENEA